MALCDWRGAAVDHKALLHEEGRGGRSTDGKYSLDLFWVNYIVSNQESIIGIFQTNSVKWEREKEEGGLIPVSFSSGIFAKYIELSWPILLESLYHMEGVCFALKQIDKFVYELHHWLFVKVWAQQQWEEGLLRLALHLFAGDPITIAMHCW